MATLKFLTAPFIYFIILISNNFAQTQISRLKLPQAIDPVAGILKLFETRSIVALDEGEHHNSQTHAFFRTLVQAPSFYHKVNDIVVEFGSCKYQNVMDRYINGEDVPFEKLHLAWRDTTQVYVFDNPVYRQFFETVRNVNFKLPKGKKLRVLLGDPAIDWSKINDFNDWAKQANRDTNSAQIIEREVIKKGHKAILIYGGTHLVRRDVYRNFEPTPGDFAGVIEQIERIHPNSTYTVWANTANDDLGIPLFKKVLFPIPSLILLKNTVLGSRDFTSVLSQNGWGATRIKFVNGKRMNVSKEEFAKFKLEDNVDALLYLGAVKYLYKTPYFTDTYADENYFRETVRRSKILNEISLDDIQDLRNRYLTDKKSF